jgi:hypothetical protein
MWGWDNIKLLIIYIIFTCGKFATDLLIFLLCTNFYVKRSAVNKKLNKYAVQYS